ncbi:YdeI/OmpD-associated family protein [Cesiribacter sp. SM1]|uniref:YdeI/OmpD-associated family protein n=1 Tax=Cesiribacter sp. SM1 TaxID=2861196 RepID=UPI001CD1EDA4|nr:YdeI/OmpD-associated family protein [Cesiribacter sp. SM1]
MEATALSAKLAIKPAEKTLFLNSPADLLPVLENIRHDTNAEGNAAYQNLLLFVHSQAELQQLAPVALASLAPGAKLWIAYPKKSSAIKTNINRDEGWEPIVKKGWSPVTQIAINNTWSALRFKPEGEISRKGPRIANGSSVGQQTERPELTVPEYLQALLDKHPAAKTFFEGLAYTHRKEYLLWITEAKKEETRQRRLQQMLEMLQQQNKSRY